MNRLRGLRGQGPLSDYDPNKRRDTRGRQGQTGKPKVAAPAASADDATQIDDPDVPSCKRSRGSMAAMMTMAKSSSLHVAFDQHLRMFTCLRCNRPMHTMHYPNGELAQIACRPCSVEYPATTLPDLWTQSSYWRSGGVDSITLRDISVPAGGFGSTISATIPVSETGDLAEEPPVLVPSVPKNFDWAHSFDYHRPSTPVRPAQPGNASLLHGVRQAAKVQLGMLMTRISMKGCDIDTLREFDRLLQSLSPDEQHAQRIALTRAKSAFTLSRVGTMPDATLRAARQALSPAREGRAAAIGAIKVAGSPRRSEPIVEHPVSETSVPAASQGSFSSVVDFQVDTGTAKTPESVLLRPDQVRARLENDNPAVANTHDEVISALSPVTSPDAGPSELFPPSLLRFTPRAVVSTPPVASIVNVPVASSKDPLISPRGNTVNTALPNLEARLETLLHQVTTELQSLKSWKEGVDARSKSAQETVAQAASKVSEELLEQVTQLGTKVDGLATREYVDRVKSDVVLMLPPSSSQDVVTPKEVANIRAEYLKIMEQYGEIQISINKSILDYTTLQSKHRLLKGEFDSLSARMSSLLEHT